MNDKKKTEAKKMTPKAEEPYMNRAERRGNRALSGTKKAKEGRGKVKNTNYSG